ncbi:TetR/AcrR family transcriptional regulator [Amycolatopsis nivea]|uniref:TetR/AcrR family transcriptional regulator n=1 Tax=Amycolatopsis nivea TaxID=1644109 RepID=UPI00106F200D|nr:TetR/AcrR family transcriptional regulator [Amycolatopsis nivea]
MAHVPTQVRSEQFIDAAVRIIAEQGVPRATTRRIAEAADAPLASLHYCFRDKDGLFLAVFQHLADEAASTFASLEPAELEVTVTRLVEFMGRWVVEHPDYALAQVDLYLWMARHRPALAAESAEVYLRSVADVLQRSAGPSVPADRIKALASVLAGVADGLVVQRAALRGQAHVDAYVAAFLPAVPGLCARARGEESASDAS